MPSKTESGWRVVAMEDAVDRKFDALVQLLIDKGLLTADEWQQTLEGMAI